jgi:hypothetical protein
VAIGKAASFASISPTVLAKAAYQLPANAVQASKAKAKD